MVNRYTGTGYNRPTISQGKIDARNAAKPVNALKQAPVSVATQKAKMVTPEQNAALNMSKQNKQIQAAKPVNVLKQAPRGGGMAIAQKMESQRRMNALKAQQAKALKQLQR